MQGSKSIPTHTHGRSRFCLPDLFRHVPLLHRPGSGPLHNADCFHLTILSISLEYSSTLKNQLIRSISARPSSRKKDGRLSRDTGVS